MSQNRWKENAELIGIVGVIASLAIVALEIRANTSAVRSATIHAIATESYDAAMQIANNDDLLEAYAAALNEELKPEQELRLKVFTIGVMRLQVNRFEQVDSGFLDLETALRIGGRTEFYSSKFFREFWEDSKANYSSGFRDYMELNVMSDSRLTND